ncbi:16S rRNA (uracil(1498)-N(3))-methyltransferase [Halalkalibacillus halophilus]|uniref:16S rRNA (uracil(1498)-N(3))-methyltransferase n=1 Tax=Halalkalibacillus halophilus TaxID=392827 RepID=UPI000407CC66|nr:16S rRNA (uracil(1498)-N(3))-methyltransferase [Halalkalibacillus halophilus]
MQRYFVSEQNWDDHLRKVSVSGDDFHHIVNVMRMKVDDQLIVCHPSGRAFTAFITKINDENKLVSVTVLEELTESNELPIHITLAQGLPKSDKLDLIIQKSTELGVSQITPLQMDRSIVKWDNKKQSKKIARLEKIAKEASEQSHRSKIPMITQVNKLEKLLSDNAFDCIMVASEYEAKKSGITPSNFKEQMKELKDGAKVLIVVGPEGGFSEQELDRLFSIGATPIRLGKRILRTETAPIYILSVLSFYFEEWR